MASSLARITRASHALCDATVRAHVARSRSMAASPSPPPTASHDSSVAGGSFAGVENVEWPQPVCVAGLPPQAPHSTSGVLETTQPYLCTCRFLHKRCSEWLGRDGPPFGSASRLACGWPPPHFGWGAPSSVGFEGGVLVLRGSPFPPSVGLGNVETGSPPPSPPTLVSATTTP